MTEVEIDASELSDVARDIDKLNKNLEPAVRDETGNQVRNLKDLIQKTLLEKGLYDTGNLLNSFDVLSEGRSGWRIWADSREQDYAMHLEAGTTRHTITPDDADALSWVPENPNKYATKRPIGGLSSVEDVFAGSPYDPETGRVYMQSVDHPGNKAYGYVEDAQADWALPAWTKINRTVRNQILRAHFKPSLK